MRVAHINLSDSSGGAAIAAMRLHRAMLDIGIDSNIFVVRQTIFDDERIVGVSRFERDYLANLRYLVAKFKVRHSIKSRGLFSANSGSSSIVRASRFKDFDAIYLHWINHGMMSIESLDKILALGKPTYWVCHDMWPITGGCHHSLECEKFTSSCKKCPSLHRGSRHLAESIFSQKMEVYSRYDKLNFIAISPFMERRINCSALTSKHRCHSISNAIDMNIFKPIDPTTARKRFSLPNDKLLLLFGADGGVNNPYKGWEYARLAIIDFARKSDKDIELVIFGSEYDSDIKESLPVKVHFLGKMTKQEDMALLYNAVDIYLNTPIAESLSYTTLEACCCTTPVVAFATGGIPSIIKHRHNGFLVEPGDIEGLSEGLEWASANYSISTTDNYLESLAEKFDSKSVAQKHLEMLQAALNNK